MHIIDVAIVVLYLIACIIIGLYKSKSIRTLKEYTLGRGYFSNIVIITTLFATYIGAGSIMISIERIYAFGAFFILIRLLFPLSWLIMGKIYGENIDQFRSCMSVSDMMELLYGKVARCITNVAGVFLSIGMVSIQFVALGYIVNYFLGISYPCGIITSALIIAIYSAFGGVRAVAFTDIFQCAVMMIAIPVAFSFLYHDVGGYKGIIQFLPEDEINLNIDKNDILLFLSMIFYAVFPLSAGVYIQRFLMCRDSIQLTHCLNVVAVMSWFFTIIICTIGLIFKIKEPGMDPNVVLLHFITHYIPIGFKGLIISGLLAMMMSTADSWLNNTSIIFVHDIIRKIIPLTERQALVFAKTFTCIICIVSALWALNSKKLLDIGLIAVNFWVPIISIPLIAGFLKFRTNSKSFMAATLLAIIFANVSGYIVGKLENISLMFGTIGSAIGLFGMHYWQVHQGTLSVNTQPTQFTETAIDKDTDIGSKALAESQGRQMFEDVEDQTKTIADELRKQSFEKGLAKGRLEGIEKGRLAEREEVAKNLLLQGLDISIIESATGLSREDLNALQKGKH